jgi:hypothetical protein
MLRTRLSPNLHKFVASSLEEIEYAIKEEIPVNEGTDTHLLWVASYLAVLIETFTKQMNGRQ